MDLGYSKAEGIDSVAASLLGTPWYMAPEVYTGGAATVPYDALAVDIWSLGVTLLLMVLPRYPWGLEHAAHPDRLMARGQELAASGALRAALLAQLRDAERGVSAQCAAMLRRCLAEAPGERPTAAELLDDPWVAAGRPYAHTLVRLRCGGEGVLAQR